MTKAGDRTIEDIIRKIPGIQIDDSGGISYDGLSINHFYIEDMDLMGKNYTVASRSINPDDISTVSVYERHQDKRVLQGKQEAEKASLNLKLKKGRMLKPLGYLKGGGCRLIRIVGRRSLRDAHIREKPDHNIRERE